MKKKAIALAYTKEDQAPRIVARGKEKIAEQILAIAREYNVPIKNNRFLVDALMSFDVGDYIPEELYGIIAELFAFIYQIRLD